MSLIHEEIYRFAGFWECDSCCRVRVYERADDVLIVVFSELCGDLALLGENNGTSITNMAETLATAWRRRYPGRAVVFVEHYPARGYCTVRNGVTVYQIGETFDRVQFLWSNRHQTYHGTPDWTHLGRDGAEALLEYVWPEQAGVDEDMYARQQDAR